MGLTTYIEIPPTKAMALKAIDRMKCYIKEHHPRNADIELIEAYLKDLPYLHDKSARE